MKDQEGLVISRKKGDGHIFVKVKNISVSFDLKSPTLHACYLLGLRHLRFGPWTVTL